jgi:hypothetical protein
MMKTKSDLKTIQIQLLVCLLYLLPFVWFELTGVWFFHTAEKIQIVEKVLRYVWLLLLPTGLLIGFFRKKTRFMTINLILGYLVLMIIMQLFFCPTMWRQITHVFTKFAGM